MGDTRKQMDPGRVGGGGGQGVERGVDTVIG